MYIQCFLWKDNNKNDNIKSIILQIEYQLDHEVATVVTFLQINKNIASYGLTHKP